jgi:hypothetical protein
MTNFYSGEPEKMQRLGRFLNETKGETLVLVCNDTQGSQYEECVEFEEPEEQQ